MGLLIASIIPGPSPLSLRIAGFALSGAIAPWSFALAQNPPTSYTPYSTPYDGTESWYCERVSAVSNGRCRFSDVVASLTTLANLTSAASLTTTGTITTGGAAGPGFNLNLGSIGYTGTLPNAQLSFTFPLAIASGGTGTATPTPVAGAGITITGSWPNHTIAQTVGAMSVRTPSGHTFTSATYKMHGIAGALTPLTTGTVTVLLSGDVTINSGSWCTYNIKYGTGAAPAFNAANTGTGIGTPIRLAPGNGNYAPLVANGAVSGLSVGTAYWFDINFKSEDGVSNCVTADITLTMIEQ
jgi:hypothetical protein